VGTPRKGGGSRWSESSENTPPTDERTDRPTDRPTTDGVFSELGPLTSQNSAEEGSVGVPRVSPAGDAELTIGTNRIEFDGAAVPGSDLPGPADLLAAALTACILKNVERFSGMLPFDYTGADVSVELTREEPPARITRARYVLTVETDEPPHRVDLLHRNILQYGTITNTLAASCDLSGEIRASSPSLVDSTDHEDPTRPAVDSDLLSARWAGLTVGA
jgi:uncharacterized OsmC-like protein